MNKEFFKKHFYTKLGESKLSILSSPLFLGGLVVKVIASFSFASHYLTKLFVPFLKYYSLSGFQNPYSYFHTLGILNAFPYPKAMLYIMSLPGTVFQPLLQHYIFDISRFEIGIYRLPILAADIIILVILSRWLKGKDTQLILLYWLSPVLFFINYLHGQLDVIPIMLSFVFLHLLFKGKRISAAIFLGIAIATKLHIVILIPFTIVYLWRKRTNLGRIVAFLGIALLTFLLINNTSLLSLDFQSMVFGNHEQFKIFGAQMRLFDDTIIFLVPFAYILLFFHSLTFRTFNRDVFVMFLGFSFCILTLLIPPMPGWYYWVIPFLIYFYAKNERFSKASLIALTLGYFLYFISIPKSDFLEIFQFFNFDFAYHASLFGWLADRGIDALTLSNLAFTFLQAALLLNILWIYRRGVESSKATKLHSMPYLIGIAGDSGSGKSTFARSLLNVFGENDVALVAGDDMHKWERGSEMWQKFTHLNPKANRLHGDLEAALNLKSGENIYRPHYSHDSGKFTLPNKLESKKLVVFEGLHSLFLAQMRDMLDLKIFIEPEEQLRIHWKLLRDMKSRGYSKEKVLEQIKKRESDSRDFIKAQEKYADIIISLGTKKDLRDEWGSEIDLDLFVEVRCGNDVNLDAFIEILSPHIAIDSSMDEESHRIRFSGKISSAELEKISYRLVPELYEIVTADPRWSDDHMGVIELFICYYILSLLRLKKHNAS